MQWIIASFVMFVASVVMYLLIRYASLRGIPSAIQNLASFAVPLILYVLVSVGTNSSLLVTWQQLLLIAVGAFFFSYLGSKFSFESLQYAPNPGYSLVLSKSYVVFTTLVSVIFLGGSLSLRGISAILLIVLASPFVVIDPKKTKREGARKIWLPLSLGAFFCWGMLAILSKYLLTIGVSILPRLFYLSLIVSALIAREIISSRVSFRTLTKRDWGVIFGIGVASAIFNYAMQEGFQYAPNIGYVNAINAASIGAVSVGAVLLFKDEFPLRKALGVFGMILGLILLVW